MKTTSTLLSWALYALALNPSCQDQLQAEVDSVLGGESGIVDNQKLSQLTYLNAVINETLRMYPAVTINTRAAKVVCCMVRRLSWSD